MSLTITIDDILEEVTQCVARKRQSQEINRRLTLNSVVKLLDERKQELSQTCKSLVINLNFILKSALTGFFFFVVVVFVYSCCSPQGPLSCH
jgi:hypothetical protein